MAIYRGVNGVTRKIKEIYRGVDGVNRKIKEEWRGVNGVNRKVFGGSVPKGVIFGKIEEGEVSVLAPQGYRISSIYVPAPRDFERIWFEENGKLVWRVPYNANPRTPDGYSGFIFFAPLVHDAHLKYSQLKLKCTGTLNPAIIAKFINLTPQWGSSTMWIDGKNRSCVLPHIPFGLHRLEFQLGFNHPPCTENYEGQEIAFEKIWLE